MNKFLIIFVLLLFVFACTEKVLSPDPPGVYNAAVPAWSPDGKTIAVSWDGDPTFRKKGIYFINTDDWSSTRFFPVSDFNLIYSPAWSPGGKWLAFSYNTQIWKIKSNGDSLTQLTYNARSFHCDWSDSDTLITYSIPVADSGGLWIMDTNGENNKYMVQYAGRPDFIVGDSILFTEYVRPENKYAHLILLNPVDYTFREVYRWEQGKPKDYYFDPKASPDGRLLALSKQSNIWTMTIDGENLKQLTNVGDGGFEPEWSPDGSRIIYVKPTTQGGELWLMNADGSNPQQITNW